MSQQNVTILSLVKPLHRFLVENNHVNQLSKVALANMFSNKINSDLALRRGHKHKRNNGI